MKTLLFALTSLALIGSSPALAGTQSAGNSKASAPTGAKKPIAAKPAAKAADLKSLNKPQSKGRTIGLGVKF